MGLLKCKRKDDKIEVTVEQERAKDLLLEIGLIVQKIKEASYGEEMSLE